jgi:hypothetical protein
LGDASANGWSYPLIFVEGISEYPTANGTVASGPYDFYWWGGELLGVNGNANNPGAPIFLNSGSHSGLGVAVTNELANSAHDYGPTQFSQGWFSASTCYKTDCSSSSLSDVWATHWGHLNLANGVNPEGPNGAAFPWPSGQSYSQTPVYLGEFGMGNGTSDLYSSGNGSQGQWFTAMVNFLQSSYSPTATNGSGYLVQSLNWTYWALNTEDGDALLGTCYTGLTNPNKEYSFFCAAQQWPLAVPSGSGSGQCGSTGSLPTPN